jgi:methionine synthase I (cobalamin-dependent)
MDFLDELQQGVLIADGAMGTELFAAGAPGGSCLEELCVSRPELVQGIHESYLAAGARMIRTNSFGANAVRLAVHGLAARVNEINWTAAQLAVESAKPAKARVAGSVGPLGIAAAEAAARGIDRHAVFVEQIGALLDGGARVIVLETFTDLDELCIAIDAKQSLHHCPVIASVSCDGAGRLPGGIALSDAFARLRAADADLVAVNCIAISAPLLNALARLSADATLAAFPSAGLPTEGDGRLEYPVTPEQFARDALALAERGARLIGGCCGAGPAHIAALADAFGLRNSSSSS